MPASFSCDLQVERARTDSSGDWAKGDGARHQYAYVQSQGPNGTAGDRGIINTSLNTCKKYNNAQGCDKKDGECDKYHSRTLGCCWTDLPSHRPNLIGRVHSRVRALTSMATILKWSAAEIAAQGAWHREYLSQMEAETAEEAKNKARLSAQQAEIDAHRQADRSGGNNSLVV